MRTPRYLPGVRNGAVAKRQGRSKKTATPKAFIGTGIPRQRPSSRRFSSRASDRHESEGRGSRVMWLMILIGVALAAGFVFALRSQINAYRIAQAEEQLKMKLDEYSSQQKFQALDLAGALSAGESERMARLNGLDNLRLDRVNQNRPERPDNETTHGMKLVSVPPVKAPRANQNGRLGERLAADGRNGTGPINRPAGRPDARPVRPGSEAKAAKIVKAVRTGKPAKVVKVVKLNSGPRESAANKAKADVARTKNRRR